MGKNNKKYTLEEVRIIAKENGFELISDEYINLHTKVKVMCNEGYLYSIRLSDIKGMIRPCPFSSINPYTEDNIKLLLKKYNSNLTYINFMRKNKKYFATYMCESGFYYFSEVNNIKYGQKPNRFDKSNPYTIQNIKLWCKLNNKPFELISKEYNGNDKKLEWFCFNCKHIFNLSLNCILRDYKCNICNTLAIKTPDLINEWDFSKNIGLDPYSISYKSGKNVYWECKECGCSWIATPHNRNSNNHTGCPDCSKSKGEKLINEYLINNCFYFDREYDKYKDLLSDSGNPLRFDFAIYKDSTKLKVFKLIEFDGQFHFKKQYDGDGHETIKYHDKLKNQYCKKNKISLLRIPYWDYDNIEQILQKKLNIHTINNSNLAVVF